MCVLRVNNCIWVCYVNTERHTNPIKIEILDELVVVTFVQLRVGSLLLQVICVLGAYIDYVYLIMRYCDLETWGF